MSYSLKLVFFGVRGSCPCSGNAFKKYGGNTSCVLIEASKESTTEKLILDLGTGLRFLGSHLQANKADALGTFQASAFVTHLHWDHIQGLPFLPQIDDPNTLLEIYGPVDEQVNLDELYNRIMAEPFFPVGIKELKAQISFHGLAPNQETKVNFINIKALKVPHLGPLTLGYRISIFDRVVTFISDHQMPFDSKEIAPEALALAENCDLLIHDAQYTDEEFKRKYNWGHCTFGYALKIAKEANAKTLVLYHHDPSHTDQVLDELYDKARALVVAEASDLRVLMARDGMQINLLTNTVSEIEAQ